VVRLAAPRQAVDALGVGMIGVAAHPPRKLYIARAVFGRMQKALGKHVTHQDMVI
jgi:hypothetical protein